MTILRANERKQLQYGLNAIFGESYDEWPELWKDIFTEETSEKAFEEEVMQTGLGAASVKPEGSGIEYDDLYETYVARYQHVTVAKAVAITEEAVEDNLYKSVGSRISKSMAKVMKYTKEVRRTNILNFGFDTNYPGGDGKPLFATDHPLGGGGVISNTLVTPADLSESAAEELSIQIGDWVDERGIPVSTRIKMLIIPTATQYVAARLFMSQYQPDTNDNNINAMYKLGTIKNGFSVNRYVSDPDSWFFITDIPDGLKAFQRRPLKKGLEGDFETGNLRWKVSERYSEGWSDPRGAAGSPGA